MTVLVVGASGATGKLVVEQLIKLNQKIKVIVRSGVKLPASWKGNNNVCIIEASILDISEEKMVEHLSDCSAVISCLGHNLTLKGVYGQPRKLVTGAVQLITNVIKKNRRENSVKFILMNTTGNRNRNISEPISFGERIVIGLLRLLLPPHVDNEKAADYLRINIGQNDELIEWVAVRPDSLINEEAVSEYKLYPSPIRSAIFNSGKTSRINVANFMARLICEDDLWSKWKGQMPVIYNKTNL